MCLVQFQFSCTFKCFHVYFSDLSARPSNNNLWYCAHIWQVCLLLGLHQVGGLQAKQEEGEGLPEPYA